MKVMSSKYINTQKPLLCDKSSNVHNGVVDFEFKIRLLGIVDDVRTIIQQSEEVYIPVFTEGLDI